MSIASELDRVGSVRVLFRSLSALENSNATLAALGIDGPVK